MDSLMDSEEPAIMEPGQVKYIAKSGVNFF